MPGHQLVPLLGQTLNDVDVLPWEVLMNEKDLIDQRDAAAIPFCLGILQQKPDRKLGSLMFTCQAHAQLQA